MTEKIRLEKLERCPLCGEKSADVLHKERHEFAYAHAAWSYLNEEPVVILRCQGCGFGYTATLPPKIFFEEVLYSPVPGAPAPLGPDFPGGKEFIFAHILRLFDSHEIGGFLLDLGASGGRFLWHARSVFAKAEGIENDKGSAGLAARHGIKIHVGSILALLPAHKADADAITLIDVLEHLPDPLAHLAAAREALKPGGHLYVKVPHQWGQLWKERLVAALGLRPSRMAINFVHINHFSEASLVSALRRLGFTVVHAQVSPPELYRPSLNPAHMFSNALRLLQYYSARAVRALTGVNLGLNVEVLARR